MTAYKINVKKFFFPTYQRQSHNERKACGGRTVKNGTKETTRR